MNNGETVNEQWKNDIEHLKTDNGQWKTILDNGKPIFDCYLTMEKLRWTMEH